MSEVKLYLGDCLDILPALEAGSVDAVVTSPRYNVGIDYGEYVDDNTSWATYYQEMEKFLRESLRILKPGGILALNVPKEVRLRKENIERYGRRVEKVATRLELMCEEMGFLPREAIVWVKSTESTGPIATTYAMGSDNNIYIRPTCEMILLHSKERYYYDNGTGRRGTKDVPFLDETKDVWWNIPAKRNGHPAPFPIEIPERLIKLFTCMKDGAVIPTILDPFMGSGTTGVACVKTGRNFIGIEIDPDYYAIAEKRIAEAQMQPRLEGL